MDLIVNRGLVLWWQSRDVYVWTLNEWRELVVVMVLQFMEDAVADEMEV